MQEEEGGVAEEIFFCTEFLALEISEPAAFLMKGFMKPENSSLLPFFVHTVSPVSPQTSPLAPSPQG